MDIAKGRAEKLQTILVSAILRSHKKGMSEECIEHLFGEALKDETIKQIIRDNERNYEQYRHTGDCGC